MTAEVYCRSTMASIAFCLLGIISFLGAPAYAAMDVAWYFTPVAGSSVYGYDQANNKSYTSGELPAGVTAQQVDGIHALYIPKATELNLGDFKGTCLSNPNLCKDKMFTVSFFLKAKEITENKLIIFDSGQERSAYGWSMTTLNYSFSLTPDIFGDFGTTHSLSGSSLDFINNGSWAHVTFVSSSSLSGTPKMYLNGILPLSQSMSGSSPEHNADLKTILTAGSPQNDKGFYVAYLQFTDKEVKPEDIGEHYRQSLLQAARNFSVSVKFLVSSVEVPSDAGVAKVPVERTGDLQAASSIRFQTSDGSAKAPGDYISQPNGELVFKPGEVFKELEIRVKPGARVNATFSVELKTREGPPVEVNLSGLSRASVRITRPTDEKPAGSGGVRDQMTAEGLMASLMFAAVICLNL